MRHQYALAILLAALILLWPANGNGETLDSKVRNGVSRYEKQQYETASQLFQDAYAKQPDNGQLAYNLANSDYKSGKFDKALGAYAKAMTGGPALKQKSLYNSGNALFRMGKLEDAAEAYKKSLELNSKDVDAKFNLEYAREQIKKQKQQQKQNNQNSDKQQNQDKQNQDPSKQQDTKQDQQQPKKHGEDSRETKDQKNQNQSNQNQEGQNQSPDKHNAQSTQPKMSKAEMTKEEADQWLSSLVENPKKFTQKQIQEQLKQTKESPVGNDW